jgi:hypothetical protein
LKRERKIHEYSHKEHEDPISLSFFLVQKGKYAINQEDWILTRLLLWYHSPFQALTASTMPRHLLLCLAGIASGFLAFTFSGVELLAPRPTPNLEDQVSEFISPRDRAAQLDPAYWVAWEPRDRHFPYPLMWAPEEEY